MMKKILYLLIALFIGLCILATIVFNSVQRIDATDCRNLSLICADNS